MTRRKGQHYSLGFQEQVLQRIRLGERIRQLSWELKVPRSVLYEWREKAESQPGGKKYEQEEQQRDREIGALEARIAELEAALGRKTLEVDFFRSALRRFEQTGQPAGEGGEKPSGLKSAAGWDRKAD